MNTVFFEQFLCFELVEAHVFDVRMRYLYFVQVPKRFFFLEIELAGNDEAAGMLKRVRLELEPVAGKYFLGSAPDVGAGDDGGFVVEQFRVLCVNFKEPVDCFL